MSSQIFTDRQGKIRTEEDNLFVNNGEDEIMTTLTLTEKDYAQITTEEVAKIAARLEQDDYNTPFEGLQDWHLLRAIAFHRPELIEPYLHLLDIEAHDES